MGGLVSLLEGASSFLIASLLTLGMGLLAELVCTTSVLLGTNGMIDA